MGRRLSIFERLTRRRPPDSPVSLYIHPSNELLLDSAPTSGNQEAGPHIHYTTELPATPVVTDSDIGAPPLSELDPQIDLPPSRSEDPNPGGPSKSTLSAQALVAEESSTQSITESSAQKSPTTDSETHRNLAGHPFEPSTKGSSSQQTPTPKEEPQTAIIVRPVRVSARTEARRGAKYEEDLTKPQRRTICADPATIRSFDEYFNTSLRHLSPDRASLCMPSEDPFSAYERRPSICGHQNLHACWTGSPYTSHSVQTLTRDISKIQRSQNRSRLPAPFDSLYPQVASRARALTYQFLPEGHIRLLEFNRSVDGGPCMKILRVSLHEVESGKYPFKAMSYCWSQSKHENNFYVNFTHEKHTRQAPRRPYRQPVGRNLFLCLLQLQSESHDAAPYFWIDALCINQNDVVEKNHQVSSMSKIYRLAKVVICWLGSGSYENELFMRDAFETLYKLGTSKQTLVDAEQKSSLLKQKDKMISILVKSNWFRRAWILQEVVLARRPIVRYGRYFLDFDVFYDGFIEAGLGLDGVTSGTLRTALITIAHMREHKLDGCSILTGLLSAWGRAAGDPRDKVFSVLGFLLPQHFIVPDYGLDQYGVFVRAAQACLQEEQDLEILSYCSYSDHWIRGSQFLPSWVPNWGLCKEFDIWRDRRKIARPQPDWCRTSATLCGGPAILAEGIAMGRVGVIYQENAVEIRPFPQRVFLENLPSSSKMEVNTTALWKTVHGIDSSGPLRYLGRRETGYPGSRYARIGDWVVQFFGNPLVFLLRPHVSHFENGSRQDTDDLELMAQRCRTNIRASRVTFVLVGAIKIAGYPKELQAIRQCLESRARRLPNSGLNCIRCEFELI